MNSRLRQVLLSTSIVVVLLLLGGATYQGVATALERRRYPHPGRLVDVGGHQLHIYCTGKGAPTVVLEAAATGMSAAWAWVQPAVAQGTRVCSYDRAGLGWSEAGDKPYDPGRVPEELHSLLGSANEPGPYVLVGQSLGASFVRVFASLYPSDTAALVLIDPPSDRAAGSAAFFTASPWLARAGVLRATGTLSKSAKDLPEPAGGAARSFFNRPDHLTRAAREIARWNDAVRLGAESLVPPSIPVVVVKSTNLRDAVLLDRERATPVSDAIRDVVRKVRRK